MKEIKDFYTEEEMVKFKKVKTVRKLFSLTKQNNNINNNKIFNKEKEESSSKGS